jgi:hypothetical protein
MTWKTQINKTVYTNIVSLDGRDKPPLDTCELRGYRKPAGFPKPGMGQAC